MDVPVHEEDNYRTRLPMLVAVDGLHSLRRITLANCRYYYSDDLAQPPLQ